MTFAIAYWIARAWSQTPAPALVRLVRHPLRPWWMILFGIAPALLSLVLRPMLIQLYNTGHGGAWIPISYFLSLGYGVLIGLAASCSTVPAAEQAPFRPGPAAAVSAVLIVVGYSLGALLRFQEVVYTAGEMIAAAVILLVARAMIVVEPPPTLGAEQQPPPVQRNLAPALVIGFLPAAMVLAGIAIASGMRLGPETVKALLLLACIVSIFCCFTSSIMLFRRHTGRALAGGILLMLLNGFIAFFFGCCVALSQSGFR